MHRAFASRTAKNLLHACMPCLASMMFLNLLLTKTADGSKVAAWKLPQWRMSHPFNAIGSVEGVRCCDIEWTMQMNTKEGGKGFMAANRSYGDIIRALHAAHDSSNNPWDMKRYPVTIGQTKNTYYGKGRSSVWHQQSLTIFLASLCIPCQPLRCAFSKDRVH